MVLLLEGAINAVLDPAGVSLTIDNVVLGNGGFPKHDTTPKRGVLVLDYQVVGLLGKKVVVRVSAGRTSSQAQEELDVLVLGSLLKTRSPLVECEASLLLVALGPAELS